MSKYSRSYDNEFAKFVAEFGNPDFVWEHDSKEDNRHAWWFAENKYIDNFGRRHSTIVKNGTTIYCCAKDGTADPCDARFIHIVQEAYKKWLAEQILLGEEVK